MARKTTILEGATIENRRVKGAWIVTVKTDAEKPKPVTQQHDKKNDVRSRGGGK